MPRLQPHEIHYSEDGIPQCSRRKKVCGNPNCKHRFTKDEYELMECPDCGEGRWCKMLVKTPGAACRLHGGESLKGAAAPPFKHGRYSQYLPPDLKERYEAGLNSPALGRLDDEAAIIETRITQLVQRIAGKEAGPSYYIRVKQTWAALQAAIQQQNAAATAEAMQKHDETVRTGAAEGLLWDDIGGWIERYRRVSDSRQKQAVAERQFITMAEFGLFCAMVLNILANEVKDRKALSRVAEQIDAYMKRADIPMLDVTPDGK